jgi:phospholipid/cholesterol/gamma-HCH transport system substrate-binding protein
LADAQLAMATLPSISANLSKASNDFPLISGNLNKAAANLPLVTADLHKAAADLPQITANFSKASADLPGITGPIKDITPETTRNILDISRELRVTSDAIGGIADRVAKSGAKLSSISLQPEARIFALSSGNPRVRSDLNMDIRSTKSLAHIGLADIGGKTSVNMQFGNELKDQLWFRYGIVQTRFGLGLDYKANANIDMTGEIFDPSDLKVNALINYRLHSLGNNWWFTTGVYDLFDGNRFGLGLTYRP